ncbi:MAG TPA: hypothetical protein VL095_09805 [Flavisolibacter sp.]|nr:hypothetical protein [Flavisolibacter sp.]
MFKNNFYKIFVLKAFVRSIPLILLLVLLPFTSFSQKTFEDSLRKRIEIEKSDTEQVRLYVQLGNRLRQTDTTESWRCQRGILKIAEKKDNDYFRGQAYLLAGTIYIADKPI